MEEQIITRHPVGKMGQPEEIAEAVVWLCSDAASFVTGHTMTVTVAMSCNEPTITDATWRVTHWMIGVRGDVPLVEELAAAEDVHSFVRGHVRWSDGTPGPAVELEDIDWTTVDGHFVLQVMHVAL